MIQGCREYGVQEPEFIDMGDAFEVPAITQKEIAQKVGMFQNGIRYTIDKLKDRGILEWEGATKRGNGLSIYCIKNSRHSTFCICQNTLKNK